MGGRKLKLGRALKNAERNKQKSLNLVVSIPRKLLHIQVCPVLKLSLCSEVKTIHWSVPWSTSDCVTAPICLCKWSSQFSSVTYIPHVHAFSVTPMGYCLTYTFDYSFHILGARGAMSTYMVSVVLLVILSVNYSSCQSPTLLPFTMPLSIRFYLIRTILNEIHKHRVRTYLYWPRRCLGSLSAFVRRSKQPALPSCEQMSIFLLYIEAHHTK